MNLLKKGMLTKAAYGILTAAMAVFIASGCTPRKDKADSQNESVQVNNESSVQKSDSASKNVENSTKEDVSDKKDLPKIGVIQLMEHTSLNIIYDSFSSEMKELGYEDGKNCEINFKNANGEMSNIPTIVQNFDSDKQDIVVAITTPLAQAAMPLTKTTPVIFCAVTDPVKAGVVTDYNITDKGMTGTTDAVNVEKIMELALKITPDVKSVGYIYNPGEDNSVSNLNKLKKFCDDNSLKLEETGIASSADLQMAANTILGKVDMLFVANDNTVAEAMPILMKEVIAAKKPIYVGADSMVMDGGFATLGIDYTDLGKETARMVDKVLKGEKVENIPVKVFKDDLYIYVNTDTAKELGIEIPDDIKNDPKFKEIKNKQ